MEVVIVKMSLGDYEMLMGGPLIREGSWIIREQYLETEEILEKEREAKLSSQHTKDLYKELHELKHPHKQ